MLIGLIFLLIGGAGLSFWYASRAKTPNVDPRKQDLSTLLVVSTGAMNYRNYELYQATIKEIIALMSKERWERPEIEWRIRQAVLIAEKDTTPEVFEKVYCVGQNIARWTVHSPNVLPWETRPFIKLLAQSSARADVKLLTAG